MHRILCVLVALAGCKNDGAAASQPPAPPPRALAGVYPEAWRCESIASPGALGEVLGGSVKQVDSALSVPRGLPHPCNYEVSGKELEYWSFDVDCRDGMKQRADALFEQYRADSRELVERYEAMADAGANKASGGKPRGAHGGAHPETDGGVERPPEPAVDVPVGAKALDHHGRGLIFIDDDAPCYVRVVGKDAARRLELAKLLAKNLTFANAPMTPRAAP
ncbi:MAG TPA: hypothetical protein VFT22_28080 [Kofleriaceae bacterium]|nr:hypothetical protein [Kofleriaceae bacterium]